MPHARKRRRETDPVFHTLDGMRGVGAILVAYGHMMLFFGGLPTNFPANAFCVDMFFMLSGYVLAFAYEPRFAKGMNASTFMRHRFVRLYPIYALGVFLGLCVFLVGALGDPVAGADVIGAFGWHALMLPGGAVAQHTDVLYPLNPAAWTLFFELIVNLIYVVVWRWLTTPRLIALVVVSAAALILCVNLYGSLHIGWTWSTAPGGMARAMFGFFIGVLVFRLNGSPVSAPKRVSGFAIAGIMLIVPLSVMPQTPETRVWVELGVALVGGPLVIHIAQAIQPPRNLLAIIAPLGAMSYAIYMLHFPVLEVLVRLDWRTNGAYADAAPWSGIAALLIVIAMAWLVDRYYDRPARSLVNLALKQVSRTARRMTGAVARPRAAIAPSSLRRWTGPRR